MSRKDQHTTSSAARAQYTHGCTVLWSVPPESPHAYHGVQGRPSALARVTADRLHLVRVEKVVWVAKKKAINWKLIFWAPGFQT